MTFDVASTASPGLSYMVPAANFNPDDLLIHMELYISIVSIHTHYVIVSKSFAFTQPVNLLGCIW